MVPSASRFKEKPPSQNGFFTLAGRCPWLIAQCPLSCGLSSFYSPFSLVRSSAGSTRRGTSDRFAETPPISVSLLMFGPLFRGSTYSTSRPTNAYGSLTPVLGSTARVPLQFQKNFSIFITDFTKVSKTHILYHEKFWMKCHKLCHFRQVLEYKLW